MENKVKDSRFYRQLLESTLGIPFSEGNKIEVLKNGKEIFPAMLQAIRESQDQIEFLTFVYWKGNIARQFAHTLSQKAKEGVRVRLILDSVGAAIMPEDLTEMMENAGVEIEWFRPVSQWKVWKTDNRTHRKVLICDVEVAFTGGVGIAEEWEGDADDPSEWRDTHFKVQGPALFGLYAAFMENWIEAGQDLELEDLWEQREERTKKEVNGNSQVQVIRTSASVRWSDIVMLYQTLIKMARKSIVITTAYFNPNDSVTDQLIDAANRGIEINIMIPQKYTDHRVADIAGGECFEKLLKAGIKLWYYQKTMLHSKIIVVDDLVCCVGSANFNQRSMLKDDEVNLVVIDEQLAGDLNKDFQEDLLSCEKVELERWKKRSIGRKLLEKVTGLIQQEV